MIKIVDFNDETTMTRPRKDIVNIMILQQLQDVLEAIEYMELKEGQERERGLPELKSRLLTLITLIRTPLSRQLEKEKKPSIVELREEITYMDYQNRTRLYEIIDYIEEFLYNKDVTKWDTKEQQDRKDVWSTKQKYLG